MPKTTSSEAAFAARLADKDLEWPTFRPDSPIRYENIGHEAHITLPAPDAAKLKRWVLAGVLLLYALPLSVMAIVLGQSEMAWLLWVLALASLPGIGIFYFVFWQIAAERARPEKIVVSRERLVVEKIGPKGTERVEMPADQLQVVREALNEKQQAPGFLHQYGFGPRIEARSDEHSVQFGGILKDEDRRWLLEALQYILAGR
jgi:uncharacterized membrane protein